METFNPEEYVRYARHAALPGFGMEAQLKLRHSSVLVVGAGGLGAPLLSYLTAAGVGRIGIVDHDRVSLSNLQRQVLFSGADIGKLKAEAARERLTALNPHVQIDIFPYALSRANALETILNFDLVADGSDNFPTRYLVNDACVLLDKPLIYGAIFRYEGQVSVFNCLDASGKRGPNYRNFYPVPPQAGSVPSCAEGGVLGVLPGIIGSMQANEAIKVLTGTGTPLSGKLWLFDASTGQSRLIRLPEQPPYPVLQLEDYEAACGYTHPGLPEITPQEFRQWQDNGIGVQLIDVREPWEFMEINIGGRLIPLGMLAAEAVSMEKEALTVVVCQSGIRSAQAVKQLLADFGFQQVFNLQGGIEAWNATTSNH